MKRVCSLLFSLVFLTFLVACSDSEPGNAKVEVYLTDAPANYDEVNIEVIGVEVHSDEAGQAEGWKKLAVKEGVYNLLELTNGLDTLLGSVELPAGHISQLRLILGSNNTITVDGASQPLSTPSAQQSGLKIQMNVALQEGITYKVLLDFDVAKSVVEKGNGNYSLKPVIRSVVEAQSGAISGVVSPLDATPVIYAIAGTDTVTSTFPDAAGAFLLRGLEPGAYTVAIQPNENYTAKTIENVAVTLGNVTQVGAVTIEQ